MIEPTTDIFEQLNGYTNRIPLADLQCWLEKIELALWDVRPYMRFKADRYTRNLMYSGPTSQALVLCWRNGQRSPIHDHRGSSCAVKVIHGVATETLFERAPNGMIYPVSSHQLAEGRICASQDQDIHQMSNLQADDADLVTFHVYSPPLLCMNEYSLVDTMVSQFCDPINDEFFRGGGI